MLVQDRAACQRRGGRRIAALPRQGGAKPIQRASLERPHAPPRHLRVDRPARAADRARAGRGRHVPAVVSRDRAAARRLARDGAAHALALHGVLRDRAGRLRPAVGSLRPHSGAARGARDLLRGLARLRARAHDRDAAGGARLPGARLVGRDRAGARDRARPLFRRARGARTVADGRHHGARAGRRADDRRRAADRVRLALAFRAADRVRADRGVLRLAQAARDVAGADAGAVFAAARSGPATARSCATARCSPTSACCRSASRACSPGSPARRSCCRISTGCRRCSSASPSRPSSAGYLAGTALAARFVVRVGLDRTIGIGALALAIGGLAGLAAIPFGGASAIPLVGAMAIYAVGMGLVQPQTIAGAMMPFPHRAGTASSLVGVSQMVCAAISRRDRRASAGRERLAGRGPARAHGRRDAAAVGGLARRAGARKRAPDH